MKFFWVLYFIVFTFFLDQISKWWIVERVFQENGKSFVDWFTTMGQSRLEYTSENILPFFNLTMVWNTGISFGLFSNDAKMGIYILSGLSLVISLLFLIWVLKTPYKLIRFSGVIVIAGALGNVWDRLRFGGVVDFLDFYIGDWHYPAFNIADSCIVIGVLLIMIHGVWIEPKR